MLEAKRVMNPRSLIIQVILQNWRLLADGLFFAFVEQINSDLKSWGFSVDERRKLMDEIHHHVKNSDENLDKAFQRLAKNFK